MKSNSAVQSMIASCKARASVVACCLGLAGAFGSLGCAVGSNDVGVPDGLAGDAAIRDARAKDASVKDSSKTDTGKKPPEDAGEDSSTDGPGGSSESGGETPPAGAIGGTCTDTSDCASPGVCTTVGGGKYCTEPCPTGSMCPAGTYCSVLGGSNVCVPDLKQECTTCMADKDCRLPSDACLTAPLGDKFCARDCTPAGLCPSGFTCTTKAAYGNVTDAGTADGAVAPGDADVPSKWCVPAGGASCTCDQARGGVVENCSVTNSFGTCTGQQTCVGSTGKEMACTAATPAAEVCNGKDDNCNGQIDEGDPNVLCAAMGSPGPNETWSCTNGVCTQVASCQTGTHAGSGTCATAFAAGTVMDVGGSPLTLGGVLAAGEVDVYSLTTIDVNEGTTNSYHVGIVFTAPAPNTEFVMDVERGDPCADAPTDTPATGITSYDWCVNASNPGVAGEAPCSTGGDGISNCGSHGSNYYVRVYRPSTATPTCTPYSITVTGGGGACDLTQSCL